MERRGKRLREIRLPEFIIQDVQSRLSIKEAARTAVLSKTWYTAWSTRAIVVLDYRHFLQRNPERFPELARKTMRRYEEQNLKIDTFSLCLESGEGDRCLLAGELVRKAIESGVNDLDIEFMSRVGVKRKFVLPREVLGSGKLFGLSMKGCECLIDLGGDGSVNCSSLKSLDLFRVYGRGDAIRKIIASSCPVIEDLRLSECRLLQDKPIRFFRGTPVMDRYLDLGPLKFGEQCVFQNLTNLMLSRVKVDHLFFSDFSSAFPRLRDLTLSHCLSPKTIKICSHSLECINIDQTVQFRAKIEAPNFRVLTCSTGHIPSLSFSTVSRQWESRIYVRYPSSIDLPWFRQFKSLLTAIRGSQFSFHISSLRRFDCNFYYDGYIKPRPVLEDLTIPSSCLGSSKFWDGLFWCSRPLLITIYWFHGYRASLKKFVSNRLTKLGKDCYIPNKSVFGQSYLEEVKVEVFKESIVDDHWEPVTWKTLLDASTAAGTEHKMRFHFGWKYSPDRRSRHIEKSIN